MKNSLLLLWCAVLLAGCASRFEGSSIEAYDAREEAAHNMLDLYAPNACNYNKYNDGYTCDNEEIALLVNKRVLPTQKKITNHLYDDPWIKDKKTFGLIITNDLYYCRDIERQALSENSMVIYCETPFSDFMLNEILGKNAKIKTTPTGKHNDLYKYTFSYK